MVDHRLWSRPDTDSTLSRHIPSIVYARHMWWNWKGGQRVNRCCATVLKNARNFFRCVSFLLTASLNAASPTFFFQTSSRVDFLLLVMNGMHMVKRVRVSTVRSTNKLSLMPIVADKSRRGPLYDAFLMLRLGFKMIWSDTWVMPQKNWRVKSKTHLRRVWAGILIRTKSRLGWTSNQHAKDLSSWYWDWVSWHFTTDNQNIPLIPWGHWYKHIWNTCSPRWVSRLWDDK